MKLQLNMIRLIMRGNYSMEGPAWKSVTAETKDLIRKLLVVNPKDRLTIEQALQHEVFHAQRFTRVAGELLCVVHEEVLDENIDECDHGGNGNDNNQNDNNQIETTRENNTTIHFQKKVKISSRDLYMHNTQGVLCDYIY